MDTRIQHKGHTITIFKEQPIDSHNMHGAIATIYPSATKLAEPDFIIGVGSHQLEARSDAFDRAKKLIDDNTPPQTHVA